MKNLGDQVFVLGNDCCFSVSAQEYAGCKRNCIYFADQRANGVHDSYVFDLNDCSIRKLADSPMFSQIFWPPPTWLRKEPCSYGC